MGRAYNCQNLLALLTALGAAGGMITADGGVDNAQDGIGFGGGDTIITFLGFEAVKTLPAIRPVVEISCVATPAAPNAESLLVVFRASYG